jgi:hypothetical protein
MERDLPRGDNAQAVEEGLLHGKDVLVQLHQRRVYGALGRLAGRL